MHLQFLLTEVFYHELKMCYSLVECAALKASLAAAKSKADAAASSSSTPAKPAPVVLALMTPVDIMTGWDSKLFDGGFLWGDGLNYLRANGGHDLVTAGMLCCSPLLGTGGKATFDTLVAHDSFLRRHGRKVYDAILLHVTRVFMLVDEAVITDPSLFAIGSANLYDIGTASMTRDMSPPDDPAAAKGPYNFVDEATTHFNLFSYQKYTWQQQLSCAYFADQQTQPCGPPGGFAKATVDTAKFLYDNKLLPYYKNASFTEATYIDSTYLREAAALMRATPRSMTLASLRTRGPGLEPVLPAAPAATKCGARTVLSSKATTFGDGHAPGGAYLDDMECGWFIPTSVPSDGWPTTGKVLNLSLS